MDCWPQELCCAGTGSQDLCSRLGSSSLPQGAAEPQRDASAHKLGSQATQGAPDPGLPSPPSLPPFSLVPVSSIFHCAGFTPLWAPSLLTWGKAPMDNRQQPGVLLCSPPGPPPRTSSAAAADPPPGWTQPCHLPLPQPCFPTSSLAQPARLFPPSPLQAGSVALPLCPPHPPGGRSRALIAGSWSLTSAFPSHLLGLRRQASSGRQAAAFSCSRMAGQGLKRGPRRL